MSLENVIGVAGAPATGKSTLVGMCKDMCPELEVITADNMVRDIISNPHYGVEYRWKTKFEDEGQDVRNDKGAMSIAKLTRTPDRLKEFLKMLRDPMTIKIFDALKGSNEEAKLIDWLFLPTLKDIWPGLGLSVITFADLNDQVNRYLDREAGKGYTQEFAENHMKTHTIDYANTPCDMPVVNRSFEDLDKAARIIIRFDTAGIKRQNQGFISLERNLIKSF